MSPDGKLCLAASVMAWSFDSTVWDCSFLALSKASRAQSSTDWPCLLAMAFRSPVFFFTQRDLEMDVHKPMVDSGLMRVNGPLGSS